jgi:hypothetical protein
MLQKIVSGGQTGVDRAALDAGLYLKIEIGGWCPKGRLSEDGKIPDQYPLQETKSPAYPARTAANIKDSDGTLILYWGKMSGGTTLTFDLAFKMKKPCFAFNMEKPVSKEKVMKWIKDFQIYTLNIAGPRGSRSPKIYTDSLEKIKELFS